MLAQYYSLPWVSFRDATWRSMRQNVSGFSMDDIMALPRNDHHPNDRGHLCACSDSLFSPTPTLHRTYDQHINATSGHARQPPVVLTSSTETNLEKSLSSADVGFAVRQAVLSTECNLHSHD